MIRVSAGGVGASTTSLPLSTSMSLDVVDVVRETRTTGRTKTRIGGWISMTTSGFAGTITTTLGETRAAAVTLVLQHSLSRRKRQVAELWLGPGLAGGVEAPSPRRRRGDRSPHRGRSRLTRYGAAGVRTVQQNGGRWGAQEGQAGRVALATAAVARMLDKPSRANLYRAAAVGAGKGETA